MAGAANRLSNYTQPPRPSQADLQRTLAGNDLFPTTAPGFDDVLADARHEVYDEGEVLLAAGDPFDKLFLVTEGTLAVRMGRDNELPVVQEVGAGELFVTRALLSSGPSPVSLTADEETTVVRLDANTVIAFLNQNPTLGRALEAAIDVTELGLRSTQPR
jgi:CRP-like cAMP-binding protein